MDTPTSAPIVPPTLSRPLAEHLRETLAFIDAQPEACLSLQALAARADCSPYHFHRQFAALTGLPPARYVLLSRLRRAAEQLLYRHGLSVLEIALASGYDSAEAFARAFRRVLGCTPSDFREAGREVGWPELTQASQRAQAPRPAAAAELQARVQIVDTPAVPIALLLHRGQPETLPASVNRFIAWRRAQRLPPSRSATYNLLYDDPATADPEGFRFGLAAACEGRVAANEAGVVAATLAGGPCAVLRHTGHDDGLEAAITALYAQWLPGSGRAPRDAPLYLQRLRFFPDVPAGEAVSDIHLPLRP